MSRFATIDMGTNTAIFLISDWDGATRATVIDRVEMTRLGKGVVQTGSLNPEARARSLEALRSFASLAKEHKVEKLAAIGTASLRDAKDGPAFREEAAHILGAPLEIISGDEEARLVALAVQRAFPSEAPRVAFDIGGGSSELVLLHGEKIIGRKSYQIGSVKFFERFVRSDPPTKDEMFAMRQEALHTISELPFEAPALQDASQLVGIAGTVTTTCAMVRQVAPYDPTRIHGVVLSKAEIEAKLAEIAQVTLDVRVKLPGLMPGRADVILAGASIFLGIMDRLGADKVTVSDHGIRHGLFWDRFGH
jgi:exopolyphosphatase/guanosine-5'-triphosphate,3'-diphosphate pyrophosphatase